MPDGGALNILLDASVVFGERLFRPLGEVRLKPAHQIDTEDIRWADALICRSKVQVNEQLVAGHHLLFVGTATAGVDHLDEDFLRTRAIPYSDASGCNAQSVADYVIAVFCRWLLVQGRVPAGLSAGVLAYGQTGRRVAERFGQLGLNVKVSDPPLAKTRSNLLFATLRATMAADVVSLHAPLVTQGEWPTKGLVDEVALDYTAKEALLLSCGRGEVTSTQPLIAWARQPGHKAAIDVWENEPVVDQTLLDSAWIATPHIAGYSLDGRVNGTLMVRSALLKVLDLPDTPLALPELARPRPVLTEADSLHDALQVVASLYDPGLDDNHFRVGQRQSDRAAAFRAFRRDYWPRRDFNRMTVQGARGEAADFLAAIGLRVL